MLYHSELGIPENILKQLPKGLVVLTYSRHAKDSLYNDHYGIIPEYEFVDTRYAKVIEVEVENSKPIKVVYRVSYQDDLDVCLAVALERGVVKTSWFNNKNDLHTTLDKSKYCPLTLA
jgi:hypothetical protein